MQCMSLSISHAGAECLYMYTSTFGAYDFIFAWFPSLMIKMIFRDIFIFERFLHAHIICLSRCSAYDTEALIRAWLTDRYFPRSGNASIDSCRIQDASNVAAGAAEDIIIGAIMLGTDAEKLFRRWHALAQSYHFHYAEAPVDRFTVDAAYAPE